MPDNHCCCCRGAERCAFFVVRNATDPPPTPTITISGVTWTFNQHGFTGSCVGIVTSNYDISTVNGTYLGLPLTPQIGSGQTEYGCIWQQSYPWALGTSGSGAISGGTLKLTVSSFNASSWVPPKTQHTVEIDVELFGNVTVWQVAAPTDGVINLGQLYLKWSTGLITVPKCPKQTPLIPALTLLSSNLPGSATSGASNTFCGTATSFSSAGSPGSASVTWG